MTNAIHSATPGPPVPAFHHAVSTGRQLMDRHKRAPRRAKAGRRSATGCAMLQPNTQSRATSALAEKYWTSYANCVARFPLVVYIAAKSTYHSAGLMYCTIHSYDIDMHVPTIQENPEYLCRVPSTTINSSKRAYEPWGRPPRYC